MKNIHIDERNNLQNIKSFCKIEIFSACTHGLCIFKKKLNENRVSNLVIIRKNAYFLLKQCILLRRTSFIGWLDFNEWVKSFFFISIENSRNSEPIFLLTCNNFCKSIIKTHKRVNAFVQIHYHKKKFD